jgi:hypothetical protein
VTPPFPTLFRRFSAAFVLVSLLLTQEQVAAQGGSPPPVPVVRVPLVAWIASRQHALPDTLADFSLDPQRAVRFREFLGAILSGHWPQALAQARALNYELVAIREGNVWFLLASDASNTGRDPTVVISTNPRREFIAEAPHVPFEPGTAEQSVILLERLGGRAAIISGAHRCASRSFSTCDGTTEVCMGTEQSYRDSDVGHNVSTLFHTAHVLFAERWPASIVISLHGMREDTEGVRTSLIVSNGIRADDASARTPATRFRLALSNSMREPGRVVSCNLPGDAVHGFRKLCGFTNVQGRHVNGDADACHGSIDQGTGRFIHLEQDWMVLQPYAQDWPNIGRHSNSLAFIRALAIVLPLAR